jgi:O-antigen/teichoic acid export membrane protein
MIIGTDPSLEIAIPESWYEQLVARLQARFGVGAFRGLLSVADQFVVSGTHFLTSVIVGRVCGPEELGDYSLAFMLYLFAVCAQKALISMPFTIYGNYLRGDERRVFSGSSLAHFAVFGLSAMALLGSASGALAWGFGPPNLAPLVGMLAVTFPLAFLVEFARQFALARLKMTTLVTIDVAMSGIQIGGLLLLASLGRLSAVGAYAAMGVGAGIAGLTWLALRRGLFVVRRERIAADAKRNWRCGRWMLVSQLTLVARSSAVLWLLALLLDATSIGIYVACETLVKLSSPLMMAVANVLFPSAARAYANRDTLQVRRLVFQSAVVLGMATTLLCGLFVWFGEPAMTKLYGEAFSGLGAIVSLLAFAMIADALDTAAANGLLAIERPNVTFIANLLGTVIMLAVSAVLVVKLGIVGAAWGSLVGRGVTSAVQCTAFVQLSRGGKTAEVQS